jgi:hypothetical protein
MHVSITTKSSITTKTWRCIKNYRVYTHERIDVKGEYRRESNKAKTYPPCRTKTTTEWTQTDRTIIRTRSGHLRRRIVGLSNPIPISLGTPRTTGVVSVLLVRTVVEPGTQNGGAHGLNLAGSPREYCSHRLVLSGSSALENRTFTGTRTRLGGSMVG